MAVKKTSFQRKIDRIDALLRRAGFTILDVCAKAGVNRSTYYDWKDGADPLMSTWDKFLKALPAKIRAAVQ